jgi:hypothetical protein
MSAKNVLLVDPRLFYQMLGQVADGQNRTTARLAEKLGEMFDPDEDGQIIISQGDPVIVDNEDDPAQRYAYAVIEVRDDKQDRYSRERRAYVRAWG